MITEGLILSMLLALLLLGLALKMKSLPMVFVSSIGWLISALQVYEQTGELLPMGLMFMVAVGQFFLIKGE